MSTVNREVRSLPEFAKPAAPAAFLTMPGEMARLIGAFDWTRTTLGPIDAWPQSLTTTIALMLHSPVPMVLLWGEDGIMLYNDGYSRFAGRRHPRLLGSKVREGWPEVADFNDNVMKVGLAGGTLSYRDRELVLDRHGRPETAWMDLYYSPVIAENGQPAGVIAIVVETTERVLADRRLGAEREQLGLLFEQSPSFMAILRGPDHRYEFVNPGYMRLIGDRDVIGKTVTEALPEARDQGFVALLDEVHRSGRPFSATGYKFTIERVRGGLVEDRYVDFVYQPMRDPDGAIGGVFVEGVDVTERRKIEVHQAALLELGDRLRDLDDPAEIAFAASGVLGQALGVSRVGYGLIDKERETITIERDWNAPGIASLAGTLNFRDYGSYIDDLKRGETVIFADAETDPRTAASAEALKAISARSVVNMPLVEQGHFVALLYANHAQARPWSDADLGLMREVARRVRDATERARSERALRESEERFRVFAQAVPNQIWAATPEGRLDWFNDQVYAYCGEARGSLEGLSEWGRIVHPDDLPAAVEAWTRTLATGDIYETEFRIRRADGLYRWFIVRAEPVRTPGGAIVRWVGTNTDIDDSRRQQAELAMLNATLEEQVAERTRELMTAEEALRQSQKMEAVGQLTGGIAHDFNNLLTGITGSLELLQARIAQGRIDELDRYLGAAQGAATRAASLTHRLLAFSRRQTLDPAPTDVNGLVAGMVELLRRTIGPAITLETAPLDGLWPVLVDQGQLENALLNLCINARDAMPDGGRLTIETCNSLIDERTARERDMEPGHYVSLCVSDTGTGMTPEVMSRAFDPFFTTKPLGQGTGLGLSMIYGFARQSSGHVHMHSEIGKGTTVCLSLPRHAGARPADAERPEPAHLPRAERTATVLVVDDDATVRMLVGEVLEELGHVAIEAVDGASGLRILKSDTRIDLLITDVGLPGGMNGRQMADAGRIHRPDLPVLFITGYAENAVVSDGHLDRGMHVLTKPFAMDVLGARIRDIVAA